MSNPSPLRACVTRARQNVRNYEFVHALTRTIMNQYVLFHLGYDANSRANIITDKYHRPCEHIELHYHLIRTRTVLPGATFEVYGHSETAGH